MTPAELRAEILTGPLAAELAAAWAEGADVAVADALNTTSADRPQWRELTRAQVLKVVVGLGAYTSLRTTQAVDGHPAQSVAWGMLTMLSDSTSTWDMDDAGVRALAPALDAIHPAAGQVPGLGTALLGIARRPGSRAEQVWGRGVRVGIDDVAAARKAGG